MSEERLSSRLQKAVSVEQERFKTFYSWLQQAMPPSFLQQLSSEWEIALIRMLMSFKLQSYSSSMRLQNTAFFLCRDTPDADISILQHYTCYGIQSYTTYVSQLPFPEETWVIKIAVISFTTLTPTVTKNLTHEETQQLQEDLLHHHPHTAWDKIIKDCDQNFLGLLSPLQRRLALEVFAKAKQEDLCQYTLHQEKQWSMQQGPSLSILIAWKDAPRYNFLYHLARLFYQHGLALQVVNIAYTQSYQPNSILMMYLEIHGMEGKPAWEEGHVSESLASLVMLKNWVKDDLIQQVFVDSQLVLGPKDHLLRAIVIFLQQVLVYSDPHRYSHEHIMAGLCHEPQITCKILDLLAHKLHPQHHDSAKYSKLYKDLLERIPKIDSGQRELDTRIQIILLQAVNFVHFILKTNFYDEHKTALSFRLDPHYLDYAPFDRSQYFPELPYGIFFITNSHFFGFHIRFKDLARGGLRTVCPDSLEKAQTESLGIFRECYQLALTQQKKNKDIPEGGSKAIILLQPSLQIELEAKIYQQELQDSGRSEEQVTECLSQFRLEQTREHLYQAQRAFILSLLVLINCDAQGRLRANKILDLWGKPEYLYLGPDENMHNTMIAWIAHTSRAQHYKPGGAFISGKPSLGFNHKEFGVTSLGVHVYLQEVLKFLKIDPYHQTFTIKMSGGPDGDVAGNEILNLYQSFPKTARLIALTDVSGTLHDPCGLDLSILVDLFHRGLPLCHYPPEKLSEGGLLLNLTAQKEESLHTHYTLCWKREFGEDQAKAIWMTGNEAHTLMRHNVHKTQADVFLPCGGRPQTLAEHNYQDFLTAEGIPTARAIVEGANLYLSPTARHLLEEKGVLIIKDSSANKGGVICSSFEVLCGLTLSDELFLKHKLELIQDILQRIQKAAYLEAHLLLSTHRATQLPLTEISERISERINNFTDQIMEYLETQDLPNTPSAPLIQCYLAFCPKLLRLHFTQQVLQEVPERHKKAVIASHMASYLIYTRGLDWLPSLTDIFPSLLQDPKLFDI